MSDVISIEQVTKFYGRNKVLDQVSLRVPPGVVFAILGENGAGKSTLIRGLLGYHRFDQGAVRVLGLDPLRKPMEIRRQVGYVADAPGLYEWMSVAQAGWFASGFYPDGFLRRYGELAAEFQLPYNTKIRDLSKGMRAKVSLALAMAFDPQLLILDEPTSGLDPIVRRQFLESMVDRAAAGQTVFLSSHQIHEVERVADWVAVLHDGCLQIASPLEDLKNSTTMLAFSMRDPLVALPRELDKFEILHQSKSGRTVNMLVRSFDRSTHDALDQHPNCFDVKAVRPNLEELYIGFTQPIEHSKSGAVNLSIAGRSEVA